MIFAQFLSGIFMATFAASGLFFLKFWKSSRDKLFLRFGIACFLIAAERVVLAALVDPSGAPSDTQLDATAWVYSFRLAAFLLILQAVISKNRPA